MAFCKTEQKHRVPNTPDTEAIWAFKALLAQSRHQHHILVGGTKQTHSSPWCQQPSPDRHRAPGFQHNSFSTKAPLLVSPPNSHLQQCTLCSLPKQGSFPPLHPWSQPRAAPIVDGHIPASDFCLLLELVCLSQAADEPKRHENQDCFYYINQQDVVQLLCQLTAFAHLTSNICMRFRYCVQWIL